MKQVGARHDIIREWRSLPKEQRQTDKQAEAFASGKDGLFGYFVGAVMKETNSRANPVMTTDLLHKRLGR